MDSLIGKKFNKLTVLRLAFIRKRHAYYECVCDCENKTIKTIESYQIKSGGTKSCGCLSHLSHKTSEETKRKISESSKGRRHVVSEETKLKISLANKGKRHGVSEETKLKISLSKMGHPVSLEVRKAISIAQKGKSESDEFKKKISYATSGSKNPRWKGGITADEKLYERNRHLKMSYGITPEQYDEIYNNQEGKCAICKRFKSKDLSYRLYVDHDHVTGKIRGLLCHNCNVSLGLFNDNADNLEAAANYIRRNQVNE